MLSVALKILSILGILLLSLLGLAVLLVFLVLFFPVNYKLTGRKDPEEMTVRVRASWLFGFLRIRYDHPEPGKILVKVLPFTVYESGKEAGDKNESDTNDSDEKAKGKNRKEKNDGAGAGRDQASGSGQVTDADMSAEVSPAKTDDKGQNCAEQDSVSSESTQIGSGSSDSSKGEETSEKQDSAILKKIKKIKYTIRSIYDKIKNIWENISYYIDLLQEEETKQLFSHVMFRVGKILKNIRPRRIRGQLLFGTGSPDTTGYAYGIYGMLSPFLGNKLLVTPDFTRAVLEGDIYISGHITAFTILWNGLKLLLDKKLKRFIRKMKAGRKK